MLHTYARSSSVVVVGIEYYYVDICMHVYQEKIELKSCSEISLALSNCLNWPHQSHNIPIIKSRTLHNARHLSFPHFFLNLCCHQLNSVRFLRADPPDTMQVSHYAACIGNLNCSARGAIKL